MQKRFFSLVLLFTLIPLHAQNLAQAEKDFQQGDFAKALPQYEQVIQTASGPEKYQAQLRKTACQYSLGEFLNSAKTILSYNLPEDPLWAARFLLYRIQTSKQASTVYNHLLEEREIEEPEAQQNPEMWTRTQWNNHITQDYQRLWQLRQNLINAPIESENLIVNVKDTDTRRIPTLFDFATNSYLEWIQREDNLPPVSPRTYLNGYVTPDQTTKNKADLSADLLHTAATLEGTNRADARVFWQTDLLMLPFERENWFSFKDKDKALAETLAQLYTLSGYPTQISLWTKLKNWAFPTPNTAAYGRSYTLYKTAQLLNRQGKKQQALDVCGYAQSLPTSYYTDQCQNLAQEITRQTFSFNTLPPAIDPKHPVLEVTARNIPQLYGRIYPVSFQELENFYRKTQHRREPNSWDFLHQLTDDHINTLLKSNKNYTAFSQAFSYQKPYTEEKFSLHLPALQNGFYAVLVSAERAFDPDKAPLYAIVVNSTDLALIATAAIEDLPENYVWTLESKPQTKNPEIFRFYTLNLQTGYPQPHTQLDLITDWQGTRTTLITDTNGTAALARPITLKEQEHNSLFVHPLAQKDGQYAYAPAVHFYHYNQPPVRVFIQTDRAIYRPGQKVFLAAHLFKRTPRGYDVLPGTPCTLTVTNAAGEKVFSANLTTDKMGSAQTEYVLPDDKPLLGSFSVHAQTKPSNRTYSGYHSFEVEEYKRPDYEIELAQDVALQYNKPGTLTGHTQYYFGTPLQGATVKYTITRQPYLPPFYWWWYDRPFSTPAQVAQGETTTDQSGNFKITFTPTPAKKDEAFAQFHVKAEVYDESGRAIETARTYKVSLHPYLFKVNFTQGFYDAHTPLALATLDLTDVQGQSATGKINVRIEKLTPPKTLKQSRRWEENYTDSQAEKTVLTKSLSFNKTEQAFSVPALEEGVYRLVLSHPQAETQNLYFIVVQDGKTLRLPDVTLPQQTTYYTGEVARILLGAADLQQTNWVEVTQQNSFLVQKQALKGGISVLELPITDSLRGGLALNWFGTSNYQFYQGSASVEVPFDNKELAVSMDVPAVGTPSQPVHWTLTALDKQKNPVNGQASISVYDKSLDYYAKKENPFTLTTFFPQENAAEPYTQSRLSGYTSSLDKTNREFHRYTPAPALPLLNLQMARRMYKGMFGTRSFSVQLAAAPARAQAFGEAKMADSVAMEEAAMGVNEAADFGAEVSQTTEMQTENATVRSDFAETAYFNAQLPITNGKATVRFTLPDTLTAWNIIGFVLTQNTDIGTFTANMLARKDFMVRLQLPRFYREGDHGILQAAVTNLTDKKINVPVTLTIRHENTPANALFGITQNTQWVTVPPQETVFAAWPVTAPQVPAVYQLTATARAGNTSDGEQKDFLILPGYCRLLATVNKPLKNGQNTLLLSEVEQDATAKPETAVLNLHPSLALSVLNSMPNLLTTPYKDLVSSLNRYVPLAVVHQFYTTYPELKQAVKKLPARSGLSAPWNEKDPLRLTLLEQTPWLRQARGRQTNGAAIINLFDANLVKTRLDEEQKNIVKFQNPSGAFTWFAGGKDDVYLTLYALESFAQALHYKAPVPQTSAQKAISYIVPKLEKILKEDVSTHNVSFALYAAYVLSSFPAEWEQVSKAKPYIQKWVDFADKDARFMTPLGQIYAAAVYHRLGDDVKANDYLDKILSRLKQNDLTGAYFAPEAQSWVWYNDTLTTQTVTLRTLLEIRPQAPQIAPMLQWLLFNRQVNEWNNSKAAAQAVFTVLDAMQAQGVLNTPVSYTVKWGKTAQKMTFKPFDWTEDLQFTKQNTQITPADYQAQITKQGGATDFASLSVLYLSSNAKESPKGVINVERNYYVRFTQEGTQKLRPIKDLAEVKVGDEVEVHLTLTTDSAFEYILLDDPKPAGFESEDLHSGWDYNTVSLYREVRDAQTRFFINWLPAGKVTLRYVLRPTLEGHLNVLPAQVQSMYAPEYGAHTASVKIKVVK